MAAPATVKRAATATIHPSCRNNEINQSASPRTTRERAQRDSCAADLVTPETLAPSRADRAERGISVRELGVRRVPPATAVARGAGGRCRR